MTSPLTPGSESPYQEFARDPNDEYERDGLGRLFQTPMTMIDGHGSVLYETEDFQLLYQIVDENDTKALEQYLTIAPWAVPKASAILDEHQTVCDVEDYFLNAAQCGRLDALKMLLAHCIKDEDPSIQVRFKRRRYELLNEAARWGQIEVVHFLLDNQPLYANIQERDPKGYTAIASAADFYSTQFLVSPHGEMVNPLKNEAVMNLLLDRGACASDLVLQENHEGKPSDTVLTLTVQWGDSEIIKRLIDDGADVHAKVTKGPWESNFWNQRDSFFEVNALFVACTHANPSAVQSLIDCRGEGVDLAEMIRSQDSRGSLPIHWATQSALPEETESFTASAIDERARNITITIGLLLDFDPTAINVQDNDGNTPLHYATRSLSRHDKLYTPVFQLLCDKGGDASIRNNKGETPLHTLFLLYDTDTFDTDQAPVDRALISILLAHGANATDVDNAGNTALHNAALNLHWTDAVSYLLEQGADPAGRNQKQETALHRAAYGSYKGRDSFVKSEERIKVQDDMLARLVKAGGAQLMDLEDAEGKTPRQICQETRYEWREDDIPAWS
ncbi:hypothetical protein BFJ69_g16584 [Fusarium oxysporum]|uniref:Ankyrin n=1 Tax=Fusarium oxysporum TaxID=5507 RepID=A0A420MAS3_FUSOX|nr:hypothetical protein BFJ69_g16584 [Fusarium oxysporum]